MTQRQTPAAPPSLPPRRWVTIRAIEHPTPRVVRLHLQGDDLAGFATDGPGAHIKLILPPPGAAKPSLPIRYEDRRAVFAEGVTPPFLRTYTPLRFDPVRLELEVELLIHGDGRAATWVQGANVGDEIVVAGPRGGWKVPDDGDWYLVAADDTAIPAATQVLAALPDRTRIVAFEVVDENERRPLGPAPDSAHWLFRGDDPRRAGLALEKHLRGIELAAGRGYAWIACEADAMRRIRKHLIEERGLSPGQMVTRGYWKLGTPDHPDGDYGQDDLGHGH
ncbi:MAG: siderophore-interacting protein [Dehalococcoidia bacterium]|nr:siderophore-interacting protein [Dehalococcoidia bacterium]